MRGLQALRVGDRVRCILYCKKCKPCPSGVVVRGSSSTFVNNKQLARGSDATTNCCGCCCPCLNYIIRGSTSSFVEGRGVARTGDPIRGGVAVVGSTDTFFG